jgi:hypothetical protein
MKIENILGPLVTPSEMENARQDWKRDPATWRGRFLAAIPVRSDVDPNEVADELETYFARLP